MRRDRIAEYDAIIAQKDADIAARDEAYQRYQKYTHDRLDAAGARIGVLQVKEVETAGNMARIEERLKACEDDRAELRQQVAEGDKDRAELRELVDGLRAWRSSIQGDGGHQP
jgi:chromosome segregation ATPase